MWQQFRAIIFRSCEIIQVEGARERGVYEFKGVENGGGRAVIWLRERRVSAQSNFLTSCSRDTISDSKVKSVIRARTKWEYRGERLYKRVSIPFHLRFSIPANVIRTRLTTYKTFLCSLFSVRDTREWIEFSFEMFQIN